MLLVGHWPYEVDADVGQLSLRRQDGSKRLFSSFVCEELTVLTIFNKILDCTVHIGKPEVASQSSRQTCHARMSPKIDDFVDG